MNTYPIPDQPEHTMKHLSLASGFSVHQVAAATERIEERLIYLNMTGPLQSVKSTWAKLKNGGSNYNWVENARVVLGKQRHIIYRKALPIGWANWIMLHKQASVNTVTAEGPFYVLRFPDESQDHLDCPRAFYPLFYKAMPFPILPDWNQKIWEFAFEEDMISHLYNSHNVLCYKVGVNPNRWKDLIESLHRNKTIIF